MICIVVLLRLHHIAIITVVGMVVLRKEFLLIFLHGLLLLIVIVHLVSLLSVIFHELRNVLLELVKVLEVALRHGVLVRNLVHVRVPGTISILTIDSAFRHLFLRELHLILLENFLLLLKLSLIDVLLSRKSILLLCLLLASELDSLLLDSKLLLLLIVLQDS